MNELLNKQQVIESLIVLPEYDTSIQEKSTVERLLALDDIYDIYIPTGMTIEIYNKLYLSIARSLRKKQGKDAVRQHYENFKKIKGQKSTGIIGGGDTLSIIGNSGIGKSTAISKAITLITQDEIIDGDIVPAVIVQTPNDCSIKGMLLEILRQIDIALDTDYYDVAVHTHATTDMLIGSVSNICLKHVGLLVVDEIQNVRLNMKSKSNKNNGLNFIAMLVQLINSTGISMVFVGTPEIKPVFEMQSHLARRTVGLQYEVLDYESFKEMVSIIYDYQYTKEAEPFSEAIADYLYCVSGGVIGIVLGLMKDAQEWAITDGCDKLCLEVIKKVFKERYQMIGVADNHKIKATAVDEKAVITKQKVGQPQEPPVSLATLITKGKKNKDNLVDVLSAFVSVEVVAI